MRIHKEGHIIVFITVLIVVLLWAVALTLNHWLSYLLFAIPLFSFLWVLYFFRVPKRVLSPERDLLLSPADGKVIRTEVNVEDEFFSRPMKHLSIFMSPFDVHLNRYPTDGKVIYYRYHAGKYLVAWHPKSSNLNERTSLVFETRQGVRFLVRQIAGVLARRIVCYADEGKDVRQGDELGFIKFGSRLDLFLPPETPVLVKPGDRVKAGLSPLADLSTLKPSQ
ncbi:MAG: phosphatidylserine decarboxylase family protein [Bacteroidales bacterium]|nr:phosphatidylserine decarboxylase family protein [Bacteroidales bacterium]